MKTIFYDKSIEYGIEPVEQGYPVVEIALWEWPTTRK
jgi:hypothetical protein